ncbi:Ankyrin [Mycena sanguinolenta]|uniref:Ankyrin n=1 Tax=Mycena sanguinolenta TaxID=230812 RepID=A0A8H6YVS9_9AGAR|nr:Ankyrin [Mycena sanguinolenta]
MAETLGIVTGCIQLLDTGLKALEYIKDFLHGPEEQRKLVAEMATLQPMLVDLEKRIHANPSSQTLEQMKEPLLTFKTALEHFIDILRPAGGRLSKVSKQLTWTLWNKKEAQEHLAEFERIKSLITVWLINDVWDAETNTERDQILEWITPLNFFQRQAEIFAAWQPGTGEWFLADTEFRDWESNGQQILWCRGIPGAGKTVLVSMVVDHLRLQSQKTNTAVACIYLNHKEAEIQTPVNLLASLWKQFVVGKPMLPAVHKLYKDHHERGTRPSLDEVLRIIHSVIGEYSKAYLIVDALDEYPEAPRLQLLKYLSTMTTTTPAVHLMGCHVLDISATQNDIRQYIDARIQKSPRLSKHVLRRPELTEEIKSRILGNIEGMFLLAQLHLDSLSTKNTVKAVRDALSRLPKDLDHTYDEAMERIEHQNEDDRQLAHLVLTWVAYAVRPLVVDELREALAIEPEAKSVDPDNLLDVDIILSVCAGLIIVDEAMSVVRLIHYTAQEYMNTVQPRRFPRATTEIASTIFTYLAFPDFSNLLESVVNKQEEPVQEHSTLDHADRLDFSIDLQNKRKELVLKHPLLGYSQYCLLYATGQAELQLQNQIKSFLATAHSWQRFWRTYHMESNLHLLYYWDGPAWEQLSTSSLWISSAANLLIIAKDLLAGGKFEENEGFDALCVAAYYGRLKMVQLLVENGVDLNHNDHRRFEEALQAAAEMGHELIARFLIELGANVNAQEPESGTMLHPRSCWGRELDSVTIIHLIEQGAYDTTHVLYGTALHAASFRGRESIVTLLIEMGADINIQGGYFGTALIAASHGGHQHVVQLLLENGADINAVGEVCGTALQAAIGTEQQSLALWLIEKGADVNAHGGYHGTVLQAAVRYSDDSMVELLIKMGADVNGRGEFYGTALQVASRFGLESEAHLLIEHGADVNALGEMYGTALQTASFWGHSAVAELLIKKGANVNAPPGTHGTALEAASQISFSELYRPGKKAIIRLLLENGADVNANGGLALQLASAQGNDDMVQFLIHSGADVNRRSGRPGTALLAAASKGHESTVRLLLENNANIEEGFPGPEAALVIASKEGHESIVRMLISLGTNVNALVGRAMSATALQAASSGGHVAVARLLIEAGADTNICGCMVGTALLAASREGHESLLRLLIEKNADINAQDELYGTALQTAAKAGHESLVRLLIENGANINAPGGSFKTLSPAGLDRLATILVSHGFHLEDGGDLSLLAPAVGVFGTAMQVASAGGHESVVRLLIEKGADVDIETISPYVSTNNSISDS